MYNQFICTDNVNKYVKNLLLMELIYLMGLKKPCMRNNLC